MAESSSISSWWLTTRNDVVPIVERVPMEEARDRGGKLSCKGEGRRVLSRIE